VIPVGSPRFVLERIEAVKSASRTVETNLYAGGEVLERWIRAGLLFHDEVGPNSFFLKKDSDFFHLFYVSPSNEDLGRGLKALAGRPEILAADVVTKAAGGAAALGAFRENGFRAYNALVRMSRTGNPGGDESDPSGDVQVASPDDVGRIQETLNRNFDRYAEQIPSAEEIAEDIGRERFLLVDKGGVVAGLVHYELTGLTSHLRRWFVSPDFRGQQVGSKLLRRYFFLSGKATRFILWVLRSNENAIEKYLHYGYRVEDLTDTIFINKENMRYGS
jgi:ribosomal protein S18 acetylase RimI-like enzyme